ncbi:TonB-dependent receptor [Azomonas macrocytogenes]|uniref:Iron complex outermembrane receptor protein n=1 Tax=Azomonas macrocytogenes TaxID=69962 RepID=A0A839T959_AZOMA|nr:TonB-dependent receptor [Azomonas macrocytogenes]MBB3104764.1 iron complex outermembrane receptor protein [Azomonas macrocytogenes]
MRLTLNPLAWAVSLALVPGAWADDALELESTVISASALASKRYQMVTPTEVLEGDELVKSREASIGETLEKLPGMRSSSFGAGVGRPVIRGQAGARVKILSDGVDVLDASSISPDHTVTSEPLLSERIEVLKGPATLMYGGGAIGGVVNVIDKKIPTYIPEKGYEGELELRTNTVANEGAGAVGITAGKGNFAVRVEGMKRQADDYEIPGSPSKEKGSYNDNHTFTLGGSFIGDRGYLGVAYSEQQNQYGLLGHEHAECSHQAGGWHCEPEEEHGHHEEEGAEHGEEDHHEEHAGEGVPYIDLDQKRWDLRGELSDPLPGFERVRLRMAHNDYQHKEMEGGIVSTLYESKATDGRLELTHKPIFGWRGTLGGQTLRRDFKSSGEEAYVPQTMTHNHAVFLMEEYTTGNWRYELGWRHEWQDIVAENNPNSSHHGTSLSAGTVWTFAPEYSLGFSYTRSQRLPTVEELYSNGPHAATRTVELGDQSLDRETAHNTELTLRKFAGRTTFTVSLYRNTISDYIYGAYTGSDLGATGYRELQYRQEDAVFTGAEGELRFQATDATALTFFGDHVRGKLRDGGGDLPRIPSDRLGVRVEQRFTPALNGQLEFYNVHHQEKVADYETKTSGYNMLNAGLGYSGYLSRADYLIYLKGNNLLDEKWRNTTSYIKDDVIMPGRNLTLGVRMSF